MNRPAERTILLDEIVPTTIDAEVIGAFTSEGDYVGVAVDLMIEAGSYTLVAANLYRNEEMQWSRDEAVLGGHLVRLYKLIDALLDQTCKHRREVSVVISRLIFECLVNLRYLIANASADAFRSYRVYSLQHELRLIERIEESIAVRQGIILPIEDRMIRSITASFAASDLTREDVAAGRERNWNGLNLFERARSINWDQAYLAAFGGGSHSIHGNWQDLLEYHLEKVDDDTYRANVDWHMPRPQILEALVTLTSEALSDYARFISEDDDTELSQKLADLAERTLQLSQLHENFLVTRAR